MKHDYDLCVIVRGTPKSGKTALANSIRIALSNLGVKVDLQDSPGDKKQLPRTSQSIVHGKKVLIVSQQTKGRTLSLPKAR